MQLRPYQQDIFNKIRELFEKKHRMILVQAPTGSGKGVLIGYIAKIMAEQKKRNWLLSHRIEIHKQLVGHCIKNDVYPGQILSGQRMTSNYTQVGMTQTIFNKLKYFDKIRPELIQLDECHRSVSKTNATILNKWEDCRAIGFSATPARTDGQGLNLAGYTALIQSVQTIDLINTGYLTPLVLLSSETTELFRKQKFKVKNGDFEKESQFEFTKQKAIVYDTVNCYKKYFNGAPCIIFCCSVEDCKLIASLMRSAGWKCEAVYDELNIEDRTKFIGGLSNGTMNAVCSYNLLSEGIDIPILAGCIIRRLTMSIIVYLQQIGRALRRCPGKKHAIVIDQAGNCFTKLGHPLLRREWTLEGKIKDPKEDEIQIRQCPNCAAWVMRFEKICPYCGNDMTLIKPEKPENIKIINAPLFMVEPPEIQTGIFAMDEAEIMEFQEEDIDTEIIKRLKMLKENQDYDTKDRLAMICKAFGKNQKWMQETWDLYFKDKN